MVNDSIYTIQEQKELSNILDGFIKYNEDQFLLLGEDMTFDIFSEELTGGSVKRAVRDTQAKIQRADKKVSKVVDNTVDAALDGGRKNEIKSIREDLMRGRGKVSTILKRAFKAGLAGCVASVATGGGAALIPVFSLIAFIISTVRRRNISEAEKRKIVFEMDQELKILDEKIRDAENDGNKKLKYQYMRLRSEIYRNMNQLKIQGKIQQRD